MSVNIFREQSTPVFTVSMVSQSWISYCSFLSRTFSQERAEVHGALLPNDVFPSSGGQDVLSVPAANGSSEYSYRSLSPLGITHCHGHPHLDLGTQSILLFSRSVMSDSSQSHELQHARLPCPSLPPRVCSNSCP